MSERPTLEQVRSGELTMADFTITAATLLKQAQVARQAANPQLAANFERAAELTGLDDADVLALYELLRPHRARVDELEQRAAWLDERQAPRCAALVREATAVYARRGLLRRDPPTS
jgi:propanediol dehydratase small subunit